MEPPVIPEERLTVLPDPNAPDAPEVVTIWDGDTPRTYHKVWDPEEEEWLYVLDEDVPLMGLSPDTGDSSRPVLWLLSSGLSLLGLAVLHFTKSRRKNCK